MLLLYSLQNGFVLDQEIPADKFLVCFRVNGGANSCLTQNNFVIFYHFRCFQGGRHNG